MTLYLYAKNPFYFKGFGQKEGEKSSRGPQSGWMTLVSMVSVLLSFGRAVSLGTTFLPSLPHSFSDHGPFIPLFSSLPLPSIRTGLGYL